MPDPPSKNILDDLNYPSDKPCIVIDLGHALTKCGVAGEFAPRWIIPSVAVKSRVGEAPLQEIGQPRRVWDFKDAADLRCLLKDYFYAIYFKYLMVNPKERPVLLVESVLWPTTMREALADVLFNHFEVPSLLLAPGHLLSLLTLGKQTGLVLDCGYEEATVVPVFEGVSVLKAWQSAPLGARALHSHIRQLLGDSATLAGSDPPQALADLPDWQSLLPEAVCEDVKLRACFVTRQERAVQRRRLRLRLPDAEEPRPAPPDFELPLDDGRRLLAPGCLRELAAEPLHEADADGVSLAALLLNAVAACPLDIRRPMADNVVVIGGTAMLPGFLSRLRQELRLLLAAPPHCHRLSLAEFKFHSPPGKPNFIAWLGGAVMAGLEAMSVRAVSREQFRLAGRLPDWTDVCAQLPQDGRHGLARP